MLQEARQRPMTTFNNSKLPVYNCARSARSPIPVQLNNYSDYSRYKKSHHQLKCQNKWRFWLPVPYLTRRGSIACARGAQPNSPQLVGPKNSQNPQQNKELPTNQAPKLCTYVITHRKNQTHNITDQNRSP